MTYLILLIYGLVNNCLSNMYLPILIVCLIQIVCQWIIFDKAGEHGWASLIPIYNQYVYYDIVWNHPLYFLLTYVPIINFIILLITPFKLAECFKKGLGFGFGLLILPEIFMLILAFDKSEYDFDM